MSDIANKNAEALLADLEFLRKVLDTVTRDRNDWKGKAEAAQAELEAEKHRCRVCGGIACSVHPSIKNALSRLEEIVAQRDAAVAEAEAYRRQCVEWNKKNIEQHRKEGEPPFETEISFVGSDADSARLMTHFELYFVCKEIEEANAISDPLLAGKLRVTLSNPNIECKLPFVASVNAKIESLRAEIDPLRQQLEGAKSIIEAADTDNDQGATGHAKRGHYKADGEYVPPATLPNIPDLERELEAAQANLKERDQNWMDGIRESCGANIQFDVDPSDGMAFTLARFVRELKAKVAEVTRERDEACQEVQRVLAEKHAAMAEAKRLREALEAADGFISNFSHDEERWQWVMDDAHASYIGFPKDWHTEFAAAMAPPPTEPPLVDVDTLREAGYAFRAHPYSGALVDGPGFHKQFTGRDAFAEAHRAASNHYNASKGKGTGNV